MSTLYLTAPSSKNEQANLQSNSVVEIMAATTRGTVLAGRYKILETIGADSFKAHDLSLDQIVTLRRASFPSQCLNDTWCQKIHQLASVRNPHFLNVLDVISDKLTDFVITEHARGQPLSELLRERPRLDVEDVLRLVISLASAIDLAAAFSCCPTPISSCWLFSEIKNSFEADSEERSLSGRPLFSVKLDIWEFVRPRKNVAGPFLPLRMRKGGSKELAVRQAALLTYELLGGEKTKEGEIERWFKPVDGLRDGGNFILFRGLQGSLQFESTGSFLQKLQSAIQSSASGSRASSARVKATQENFAALPRTRDMIRRFNRDTWWVATAVLGTVIFAAMVLAVQVQERRQERRYPASPFTEVGLNGKDSPGRITSEQTSSPAHPPEISSKEIPSRQIESAASPPTTVLSSIPQINHINAQPKASPLSPVDRQNSTHLRPNTLRARNKSSVGPRYVGVKRRLIELWHESLAKSEKRRSWTTFSNLSARPSKKAAYTAETNHDEEASALVQQ